VDGSGVVVVTSSQLLCLFCVHECQVLREKMLLGEKKWWWT
jgi:hypothetical protein